MTQVSFVGGAALDGTPTPYVGWGLARLTVTPTSLQLRPTIPGLFRTRLVPWESVTRISHTVIGLRVEAINLRLEGYVFWPVPATRRTVIAALQERGYTVE
jgi:hypothetical protein